MTLARRLLLAALLGAACRVEAPPTDNTDDAASASAPSGDALCEHGVLGVACPKCLPALATIYQAKGDWCAEHGLPLSFCPVHHPERGGRPAVDVGRDEAPADGTKVRLKSPEIARRAGIAVAKAEAEAGAGGLEALATITWDATRVALVSARAPGVVRELRADLGTRVQRGQVLAVLDSARVGEARASAAAAQAKVTLRELDVTRLEQVGTVGSVSPAELDRARAERAAARAELAAAEAALGMTGAGEGAGGRYTLTAPLSGVITRRDGVVGGHVEESAVLFEVVDPSHVWADVQVPEGEVADLRAGQALVFTADTLGGRDFPGTVASVAPGIDPGRRTVLARAALPNPDGLLRANLHGRARIDTPRLAAVTVPAASVQRARGQELVFVRLAEDLYEARRVEVAARAGDRVTLRRGIAPGEEVVTEGSFLLKTETLKDSIGAGCCDVE